MTIKNKFKLGEYYYVLIYNCLNTRKTKYSLLFRPVEEIHVNRGGTLSYEFVTKCRGHLTIIGEQENRIWKTEKEAKEALNNLNK